MVKTALILVGLLCNLSISLRAQGDQERWQRVYTGDDSVIDVNVSSLKFDASHVLRMKFRTVLSKPESLRGEPGTKYKSRLETIEFKSIERQYRFLDVALIDSTGKTVQSSATNTAGDWKVLKDGGMMQRLFDATRRLPPFGDWKVIDYRFAESTPIGSQQFTRLLGTVVRLGPDRAQVGMKVCSAPAYQSKPVTDKEFVRDLGISLEAIGIKANHADTIVVKCETNGWAPPQSLLVKLPEGGLLMLWEGVFLVLKKQTH
jgi:hypothetical protein